MIFGSVSWGEYILTVLILLSVYYTAIGIKYYSLDIRKLLSGRVDTPSEEEKQFAAISSLTKQVKAMISFAFEQNYMESEVLTMIKPLIGRYPKLRQPASMRAINHVILSEIEKYGSYKMNEKELEELWIG